MDETSTNSILNLLTNREKMEKDVQESLSGDELIFYHALRTDLDQLKKNPSVQTIHRILDYSKSLR